MREVQRDHVVREREGQALRAVQGEDERRGSGQAETPHCDTARMAHGGELVRHQLAEHKRSFFRLDWLFGRRWVICKKCRREFYVVDVDSLPGVQLIYDAHSGRCLEMNIGSASCQEMECE